jgi:hypothetical protein
MDTKTHDEAPLPRNNGAKSSRIDLGLAVLSAITPRGVELSPQDIAAWCDCTPSMITAIETKALRRMRQKAQAHFKPTDDDPDDTRLFLAPELHA